MGKPQTAIQALLISGRERAGISQQDLADALGVAQTWITKIEAGRGVLHPRHAEATAKALGIGKQAVVDAIMSSKYGKLAPLPSAPATRDADDPEIVRVRMPVELQARGRAFAKRRRWPGLEEMLVGWLTDALNDTDRESR